MPAAIRWGFALAPLLCASGLYFVLGFLNETPVADLRFELVYTLGVAWVTLVLLRGRGLAPHGRRIELVQMGASVGVALAAAPMVLGSLHFVGVVCFSALILLVSEPERTLEATPFVGAGFLALGPIGTLAICSQDALRTLRHVRHAPLSCSDVAWLFLGLFPSAYLARIGFYLHSMFKLS